MFPDVVDFWLESISVHQKHWEFLPCSYVPGIATVHQLLDWKHKLFTLTRSISQGCTEPKNYSISILAFFKDQKINIKRFCLYWTLFFRSLSYIAREIIWYDYPHHFPFSGMINFCDKYNFLLNSSFLFIIKITSQKAITLKDCIIYFASGQHPFYIYNIALMTAISRFGTYRTFIGHGFAVLSVRASWPDAFNPQL